MKRLLFSICICVGLAFAEVEVLQPGPGDCCDSWVLEDAPDQNWGDWTALMFGCTNEWDTWLALLRFDELDDPRFDDIILQDAALWLMPQEGGGSGSPPLDCFVRKITEDWDQDTVTWNNRPDCDFPFVEFTYLSDSDWFSVDVTEIVQEWLENGVSNHGFYLRIVGGQGTCGAVAHSGEYTTDPAYRPKLTVDYSGSSVVETSWGSIKALE